MKTLQDLTNGLTEHGDRPAVLALTKEDRERWTYAELADSIEKLAAGLGKAGLKKGEVVALLAGNQPEWVVAALAILRAGGVVTPLDVQLDRERLQHILQDSEARLIFTEAEQLDQLEQLELETELEPILFDAEADDERGWRQRLADEAGDLPQVQPDDTAVLFYTSGTTGPPKGVPLEHRQLVFQINTIRQSSLVNEADRVLLPLPLHHVYPFVIGMLTSLGMGLPLIFPYALTGPQLRRGLQEGEATVIVGVPRLYQALFDGIRGQAESGAWPLPLLFKAGLGLSVWLRRRLGVRLGKTLLRPLHKQLGPRLRILAVGGAAIKPELAWQLEGLGWQVGIGYGLTETAPMLTLNPPGQNHLSSAGKPIDQVELRLDPAAQPGEAEESSAGLTDQPDQPGEILARGPNVFSGYHQLPEKTEESFTEEGWFRTGDLGHFDKDGYLYITGRVSTVIVTESGENIQPDEVEAAYADNPAIREVGVLEKEGQLVGVVVPEIGQITADNGDLETAIHEAVTAESKDLPSYQQLSDYAISRDSLSRTRLGKIRRHLLPERYEKAAADDDAAQEEEAGPISPEEMSDQDRALLENPAARQVWDWLARRYSDRRLTPDTAPQLDLGVDSMEWLTWSLEIRQQTGIELSESAISRVETLRDLLQEVIEAGESEAPTTGLSFEEPESALDEQQQRWLEPRGAVRAGLAGGLYRLNRLLIRSFFGLQVKGLEHVPEQGSFVLAPNHASYLDPLALAAALDRRRLQQVYWAGSTNVLFGNPFIRLVSRIFQIVPIDPAQAAESSLAFGAAVLQRDDVLVWFPEGRRSSDGQLQPFRPGIGLLLENIRAPVIPVYIDGAFQALPMGKFWPRFRTQITVNFGRPLEVSEVKQQEEDEQFHERVAQNIHDRVAELN